MTRRGRADKIEFVAANYPPGIKRGEVEPVHVTNPDFFEVQQGGPFIPIADIATLAESQAGISATKVVPTTGLPIFKPNGTALQADLGGNARGANAIDLQQSRSAATQVASGINSIIGGGLYNSALSNNSTVAGGFLNIAGVVGATVGGGASNTASGAYSTISGGAAATASGNRATVAGGDYNEASGAYSFAAGRRAKAVEDGTFALSDSQNADFTVGTADVFGARFAGGYWLTGGDVVIGDVTGDGKLSVDQDSVTGAIPVIELDQADLSEQFMKFITTIGEGNPTEAIGAKSLATTHFIRVEIDGVGDRYFPVGTIA